MADERPDLAGAEELLARARTLTTTERRHLARGVNAAARFAGSRRGWSEAMQAATDAADAAGLGDEAVRLLDQALFAALESGAASAEERGRDASALRAEIQAFQRFERDRSAIGELRLLARETLGRSDSRRIGPASIGIGAAAVALLTRHLASPDSAFTIEACGILLQPWRQVIWSGGEESAEDEL